MADKYDPLDDEKTMMNLNDSDLSMGDANTVGSTRRAGDLSMGDIQTMAGGTPAVQQDAGFEGKALSERYEIIEEIGRGGFAVVYKARDKRLRRDVVVKRLHFEQAGMDDEIIRKRFEHEAHAIAALNHQNIVQVYDYDRDAEGHYIVMEYVSGGSLKDLLKQKGNLEVKEAVRIVKAICGGLAFAHRKNLIHRDIKPANILLAGDTGYRMRDAGGKSSGSRTSNLESIIPKIADFGLARSGFETGMSMSLSMSGTGMGTPYYMPPEQREDAKNVNHTADIYAVGKTLYQLVTGDIPDNVDPDLIPPPPELAKIIFKCVKTRPEDRYFSMEELVKALEGLSGTRQEALGTGNSNSQPQTSNPCPKCGRGCSDMEMFCAGCGEDLGKACPECGQKNSMFRKFCNSCGTDTEGFGTVKELDRQIGELEKAKDWEGIVAAADRVPENSRLGEKGKKLQGGIGAAKGRAQKSLSEIARLEKAIVECAGSTALLNTPEEDGKLDRSRALQSLRQLLENLKALDELKPLSDPQKRTEQEARDKVTRLEAAEAKKEKEEKEAATQRKIESRRKRFKRVSISIPLLVALLVAGFKSWITLDQWRFRSSEEWKAAREAQKPLLESMGIKTVDLGEGVKMDIMPIPAGSFQMGSNDGASDEKPVHKVILTKPFWMAKTEVTEAQYNQVMGKDPYCFQGSDFPVTAVYWRDAVEFCRKLTVLEQQAGRLPEGYEYALPTEEQWEYACRAGTTGDYAGNLYAMGWHYLNSPVYFHPVGQKQANAWGLYDMHGNVFEFCNSSQNYPSKSMSDRSVLSRGGSWRSFASNCRSAYRNLTSSDRIIGQGFRAALVRKQTDNSSDSVVLEKSEILLKEDFESGFSQWDIRTPSRSSSVKIKDGTLVIIGIDGSNYSAEISRDILPKQVYSEYTLSFDWKVTVRETPNGRTGVRMNFYDRKDNMIGRMEVLDSGQTWRNRIQEHKPSNLSSSQYGGSLRNGKAFNWEHASVSTADIPGLDKSKIYRIQVHAWVHNDAGSGGDLYVDNLQLTAKF